MRASTTSTFDGDKLSLQASGKTYEVRIAKIVGGEQIKRPSYGTPAADVEHPDLVIECKLRKELAIEHWVSQVEAHTEPGKINVVCAKQKHLPDDRTIVCLRLPDFLSLLAAKSVEAQR